VSIPCSFIDKQLEKPGSNIFFIWPEAIMQKVKSEIAGTISASNSRPDTLQKGNSLKQPLRCSGKMRSPMPTIRVLRPLGGEVLSPLGGCFRLADSTVAALHAR
jgi:hypothetical protein